MNNELEGVWKQAVVFHHLPGGTEENKERVLIIRDFNTEFLEDKLSWVGQRL